MVLAVSSGTVVPAQMRAAGAATIFFDLHLNDRIGTTSAPADPATIELKAKKLFDFAVQVTRLRDAADRGERALRRADADAVEYDERAVPRERAVATAGSCGARRDARDHDREPALHRRRGGRLVARGGEGGDPDPPGLLHVARAERSDRARPGACEPVDAEGDARSGRALRRDRHSGESRRARAAVPVGARSRADGRACSRRPPGSSSSSSRRLRRSRLRWTRRSKASGPGAGRVSPSPATIPTSRPPRASTSGHATRSCVTPHPLPVPVSTRR